MSSLDHEVLTVESALADIIDTHERVECTMHSLTILGGFAVFLYR